MQTSKKFIFTLLAACFALPFGGASASESCKTASECWNLDCGSGRGRCCPTGAVGNNYTCPRNWTFDYKTGLCVRKALPIIDERGYGSTKYGSCDATTTTYNCFAWTTAISPGLTNCLTCSGPDTSVGGVGGLDTGVIGGGLIKP